MAYARKKQADKIKKLIEKQKKKAEKVSNKKYQGFGDKKESEDDQQKRKERKELKKKEQTLKKAQVSQAESDLMRELLKIGECAVAESETEDPRQKVKHVQKISVNSDSLYRPRHSSAAIKDFEESQTIEDSDSQNLSEELDKLFELN